MKLIQKVRTMTRNLRNAGTVMKHYLKWPYPLYMPESFNDFSHEHLCFAARLCIPLSEICPCCKGQTGFIPGRQEDCENCRYFGTVSYPRDPATGAPTVSFHMNEQYAKPGECSAVTLDLIDRAKLKPDLGDAEVEYGAKPIHYSQDVVQSAQGMSLFQAAKSIDYTTVLQEAHQAQSKDERDFYIYLANTTGENS